MPNRLSHETSPYLLQHQNNPVDWYPWGSEALERAKTEDKPIMLSIGYSACHWCHVMEHESFENPAIAALMNEHFINIKVDREERPDLDSLYMGAVQALAGHGGWPMTVFLTPEGRPFFGGTYFPPQDGFGRPGFPTVLRQVAKAFHERRQEVEHNARLVSEHLGQVIQGAKAQLDPNLLTVAAEHLRRQFDPRHGGFGGAPKFPPAMSLEFLMRDELRSGNEPDRHVVTHTLDQMARGGLYDQIGGGFHRYSVDAEWLVPHFEKMLYDNALLSRLYVLAYQAYGTPQFRRVAEETYDWVMREMTSPDGAFYATLDADSEGEEGKFYVWTPDDIREALGTEAARVVNAAYGITPGGNFEHRNIPSLHQPLERTAEQLGMALPDLTASLAEARAKLYAVRSRRVWPARDEKVLTAWNGMMLRSFAEAARILDREDYAQVAVRNAEFLLKTMLQGDRLLRTAKAGVAKLNAYLEDYANLADGLLALYEATFDPRWLNEATRIAERMVAEFWDDELGGFFDTGRSHEQLVARPRDPFDNATPAGNSVACDVLVRLAYLLGRDDYRDRAGQILEGLGELVSRYPNGFGRLLCVLDFVLARVKEVAIVGAIDAPGTRELIREVYASYMPHKVVAAAAVGQSGPVTFLSDRPAIDHKPTAYVCVDQTCGLPITLPDELRHELQR